MNKSKRQRLVVGSGLLIIAVLWLCFRFFGISQTAYAEVTQLQGEAVLVTPERNRPIAPGDRLEPGSHIKTGADSGLTLMFADGSLMQVSENSDLMLDSLLRSPDSERVVVIVDVNGGRVESSVEKQLGFGAKYEVRTPALQLAVRGTEFTVAVEEETGISSAMVNEGQVAVSSGSRELTLDPGYGTVVTTDGEMAAPRPLLPAPRLLKPADVESYLPLRLQWEAQREAAAYRVQLLAREEGSHLLREEVVSDPYIELSDLPDRDYLVKVRSVDAQGLESAAAERIFTLNAHPLPPVPTFPLGQRVGTQTVRFAWAASAEARQYLFQISDTDDFSHIVTQIKGLPSHLEQLPVWLQPGRYYWRIAGYHPDEGMGPFAPAQRFTVSSPANE